MQSSATVQTRLGVLPHNCSSPNERIDDLIDAYDHHQEGMGAPLNSSVIVAVFGGFLRE